MFWNALILALREIRRNVLRSFLTTLGIVIGVAAVIIIVTIGNGSTLLVKEQISTLGSNLITLIPGQRSGMGMLTPAPSFKDSDVKAIAREIDEAKAVVPNAGKTITAVYGNQNWSTPVKGSSNEFFIAENWQIALGREFTNTEQRSGSAVCILGETPRKELFGAQDPVGSKIRLDRFSCVVTGVLKEKGQIFGNDPNNNIIVPLRTYQRRIAGNQNISNIQISLADDADTDKIVENVVRLMRERRNITANKDDDFQVLDMKHFISAVSGQTQILTVLLGSIAAISLLVGGIGIMNIMLVSVTERTREIGIRLAIGALKSEVMLQFLVESVVLSAFGGLLGILLAVLASIGITNALNMPFVLDPTIVVIAFLFSAAVGIIFGYFPARKAAELDPIDALRHE